MKNTMKKLPFLLAFVVTLFVASCSDDVTVEPVHTDEDKGGATIPPPPMPTSSETGTYDSTSVN